MSSVNHFRLLMCADWRFPVPEWMLPNSSSIYCETPDDACAAGSREPPLVVLLNLPQGASAAIGELRAGVIQRLARRFSKGSTA